VDTSPAPLAPRPAPGLTRVSASHARAVIPLPVRDERVCARPSCRTRATATLSFSYADRLVELEPLREDRPEPQTYDLCPTHAARTRPPHGWELRDRRPEDDPSVRTGPLVPADLGGDRTVAVLAAALRAVPGAVSEDARPGTHRRGPAGVARTPHGRTPPGAPSGPCVDARRILIRPSRARPSRRGPAGRDRRPVRPPPWSVVDVVSYVLPRHPRLRHAPMRTPCRCHVP
jgi:hypothetical protein